MLVPLFLFSETWPLFQERYQPRLKRTTGVRFHESQTFSDKRFSFLPFFLVFSFVFLFFSSCSRYSLFNSRQITVTPSFTHYVPPSLSLSSLNNFLSHTHNLTLSLFIFHYYCLIS